MADKRQKPPQARQEPFVKLPRDLLRSDAMRSIGVNEYRVILFLLSEHMRHGGQENGKLKAPYRQLAEFGVCACYIPATIRRAEDRGLIRCNRGGLRVATTFAVTWLPTMERAADGKVREVAPTDDWRQYRNPALRPLTGPKSRNLHSKGDAGLHSKGDADGSNLRSKGDADEPKTLHRKCDDPSRRSYQDRGIILGVSGRRAGPAGGAR